MAYQSDTQTKPKAPTQAKPQVKPTGRNYGGGNIPLPQAKPNAFLQAVDKFYNTIKNSGIDASQAVSPMGFVPLPQISAAPAVHPLEAQRKGYMSPDMYYNQHRPMGTGMNLRPEDFGNLNKQFSQSTLSGFLPRDLVNSQYKDRSIQNNEEALIMLPDNYAWVYPEATPDGTYDASGGADGGTGGAYADNYMYPDYPLWGGGGYDKTYFRDNGLINWRI